MAKLDVEGVWTGAEQEWAKKRCVRREARVCPAVDVVIVNGETPSWAQGGFKECAQWMMELPLACNVLQPQGPLHPTLSESTESITPCNLASSRSLTHTQGERESSIL